MPEYTKTERGILRYARKIGGLDGIKLRLNVTTGPTIASMVVCAIQVVLTVALVAGVLGALNLLLGKVL